MADNVAVTPGVGVAVATDEISGAHYQRIKLNLGAEGAAADLAPGRQAAAVSLPAVLSTEDLAAINAIATAIASTNTKLDTLTGNVDGLETLATALNGYVDTLETLIGTTNTSLTSIAGYVDGLEALSTTLNGYVDGLEGLTGALTETAPASDTASSGLNGRLQRIAQRLTSLIALVPASLGAKTSSASFAVVLASDQATVPVSQVTQGYDVAVTVTRPANTTAYTAVDVVGGAITFASMGPSAASIILTGAQLELDIAAIPSGMTSFRLYLYSVTPPSATADNAAFDLPSGDRASFLGYIDLGTPVDLGSTCYIEASNINKQIKLAGTSLFAYLVTAGGYTPAANSEVYKLTLHAVAA